MASTSPADIARSRILALAWPFAMLGAATGLFEVVAAGGRSMRADDLQLRCVVVLITAGFFAFVGACLARWPRLRNPMVPHRAAVALIVCITGCCAATVISHLVSKGRYWSWYAAWGTAAAAAVLPACFAMIDAALLLHEARPRSIVGRAQHRTLWSTTAMACAVITAPAMGISFVFQRRGAPFAYLGLSMFVEVAALLVIVGNVIADRRARATLAAIDTPALRKLELDELARRLDARGKLDVGLGQERWTSEANVVGYRSHARHSVVLRGNPELGSDALRATGARHRRAFFITATAFGLCALGGWGMSPCDRRRTRSRR